MQAVLSHPDGRWGELGKLVPIDRSGTSPLLGEKGVPALSAAPRPVLDDLVHLLQGHELAVLTFMPGLAAGPTARLGPLRPGGRRGRILGGRKRGVLRGAVQALFKLGHAGLEAPVGFDELADAHE